MSPIYGQMTLAVLLIAGKIVTASTYTCEVEHVIRATVRNVDASSGSDVMNMTVTFQESAKIESKEGKRQTLLRHFPNTPTIRTDLSSLKLTTKDGHSLPWTEVARTGSDQILGVSFVLDGNPDDVFVDFQYVAHVRSETRTTEEAPCGRIFHQFVYPVVADDCSVGFEFVLEPSAWGRDECSLQLTAPVVHANTTPAFSSASRRPVVLEIAMKCFGGETCTCACSQDVTSFCREHLTQTKVRALLPGLWNDRIFTLVIAPFFLSVLIKMLYMGGLRRTVAGDYLMMVFNVCLIFSVSCLLAGALVVPVHFDASIRACSTVFESREGGYFLPLLFWTYFPCLLTLLIATGFIDNADLVVSLNGNVKKAFALYQYASPLAQIWLFLYAYVVPMSDALLLTGVVSVVSCLVLYFRNPFRSEHNIT